MSTVSGPDATPVPRVHRRKETGKTETRETVYAVTGMAAFRNFAIGVLELLGATDIANTVMLSSSSGGIAGC